MGAAGGVGADQHWGAVPVGVGDLGEGRVENGDVVGGGVRPGPTWAQHPGQGFAGVVQEVEQRMKPEALLPGRCGLLLLRMRDHNGRIEVQDQARHRKARCPHGRQPLAGLGQLRPGQFPRRSSGGPDPDQARGVDAVQQPPRGRVRGHRPEQFRHPAQDGQVGDRLTAIGEHRGQVDRDPAPVMTIGPTPGHREGITETAGQPRRIGNISEQTGSGMADHTPTIRGDLNRRTRTSTMHLEGAFRDRTILF